MSWNQKSGVRKHESKWKRALWALPLLGFAYGCQKTMGASIGQMIPALEAASSNGQVIMGNEVTVSLYRRYFGVQAIDEFIAVFVAFFTPIIGDFDPVARAQAAAFLGDLIPIQVIWLVEGARRGNHTTAAHLLPTIFGILFQMKGIGFIAPIYFFLHYIQSPLENYAAAENRSTQISVVKTIIPTVIISYIVPSIAMFLAPDLATRQWINGLIWQPFPVYASILQRVFGLFVKDTTQTDRITNPEGDMPYLRRAYGFAAVTAALGYLYIRITSPAPLLDIFFTGISAPSMPLPLVQSVPRALRYDQICSLGSGAFWTMLSFSDLKSSGKLTAGWAKIVGVFAAIILVGGPGAAIVVMWAWREEILAKKNSVTGGKM